MKIFRFNMSLLKLGGQGKIWVGHGPLCPPTIESVTQIALKLFLVTKGAVTQSDFGRCE